MPDAALAAAFSDFAIRLEDLSSAEPLVDALAETGPALVGGGQVSLLLRDHRELAVTGPPDAAVTAQLDLAEGPALDAATARTEVLCPDLVTTRKWSQWSPYASSLGWRSWLSLPLTSNGRRLGILNVASRTAFEPSVKDRARILAAHVAVAVHSVQLQNNLELAQDAQLHVGQAVGLLMERYELTADQAFGVLKRFSQGRQLKLRDVAADLLTTRQLPEVHLR